MCPGRLETLEGRSFSLVPPGIQASGGLGEKAQATQHLLCQGGASSSSSSIFQLQQSCSRGPGQGSPCYQGRRGFSERVPKGPQSLLWLLLFRAVLLREKDKVVLTSGGTMQSFLCSILRQFAFQNWGKKSEAHFLHPPIPEGLEAVGKACLLTITS